MKFTLQTFKSILEVLKQLPNQDYTFNIFGDLIICINKNTYNLGQYKFDLKVINSQIVLKHDRELKQDLNAILELKDKDFEIYYQNLLWLEYIDYMTIEVENYTYSEFLIKILDKYIKHTSCGCLDILCFLDSEHSGNIKYFSHGTISKNYLTGQQEVYRLSVVDMPLQKFITENPYLSLISIHPNYETYNTRINYYQQVKSCKANGVIFVHKVDKE